MMRLGRLRVVGSLVAATLMFAQASLLAQTTCGATPPADAQTQAPDPATPSAPTFADLFKDTIRDFGRLPSYDTLLWLSAGATAAGVAHVGDAATLDRLSGSSFLGGALKAGPLVGGTSVQMGGAFATYAIGRLTTRPAVAEAGADLLRAQLLTRAMTDGLKLSVRRTRPNGGMYSFPSGHASASFASATVLQRRFGWKVGVPAYIVASYVAASRVQSKQHYLSDVVFGSVIGIIAGRRISLDHDRAKLVFTPVAVSGGGGVAVTWIGGR